MRTYTTEELAELLHTSRRTVQMLREEGALEGTKGKGFIYSEEAVSQFLERFAGHSFTDRQEVKRVMGRRHYEDRY